MPIAHELTERQKTKALQLMEEAARTLRISCSKLVNQGNENWNIVSKYVGNDDAGLNKARLKMDSLVARDFDQEKVRLDAKNATLIANPVADKSIVENLRIRGYNNTNRRERGKGDRPVEPASPNQGNNAGAKPKAQLSGYMAQRGRGKRRRSRSRSRSPSRNRGQRWGLGPQPGGRGRGGQPFRDNRGPPQVRPENIDPDAMAAIFRRVVQEMQPNFQNPRGLRDDYRY